MRDRRCKREGEGMIWHGGCSVLRRMGQRLHVPIFLATLVACTSSTEASSPAVADESHLSFGPGPAALWSEADGTQVLQVDVRNDADTPTFAATGTVEVVGKNFTGELFAVGGVAPRALAPHEDGVLQVRLWGDSLHRCSELTLIVRHDPTLDDAHQNPGVHQGIVKTPCLRWDTPIDLRTVPALRDPTLDQAAIAAAAGKTLDDVVSSRVSGRADGKLCSDCHHQTSLAKYNPLVAQGSQALAIAPSTTIAANQDEVCRTNANDPSCLLTWASNARGWAIRFNNTTTYPLATGLGPKPAAVRAVFAQWLEDGAL